MTVGDFILARLVEEPDDLISVARLGLIRQMSAEGRPLDESHEHYDLFCLIALYYRDHPDYEKRWSVR